MATAEQCDFWYPQPELFGGYKADDWDKEKKGPLYSTEPKRRNEIK
jgi:hypothetical protein